MPNSVSTQEMGDTLEATAAHLLRFLMGMFPLKRPVTIEWRNLRTTAGLANWKDYQVVLSRLLVIDHDRLSSTLKHEYAHLLAIDRDGPSGRGHGPSWRKAMADLGEEPTVRHRYECHRNESRQVVLYRCAACGVLIQRRRRLPRGKKFFHRGCDGEILFVTRQPLP
jgi:predicted SprT family Zn-dependent metalloprotease